MHVDVIYRNGDFRTLDPSHRHAHALAVFAGRICGLDADIDQMRAQRVIDLNGAPVVPGFHDAHAHTAHFGLSLDEIALSTPPVADLDQLYRAVAARAAGQPAGSWVVGWGYDQNKLGAHPHRARLDEAAGNHRVWLKHTSGTCAWSTPRYWTHWTSTP